MAGEFIVKTHGFNPILKWLDNMEANLTTQELMKSIGVVAKNFVIKRTLSGKDVNGASFKIYSIQYARMKGVSRSPVNLRSTGQMLASMTTIVSSDNTVVIVGFDSGEGRLKAIIHTTGAGNNPERDFLGLNLKELNVINNMILQHIENLIEGRF